MRPGPRNKPTALRLVEGNRSKRPIPENEPEFAIPTDMPDAPPFLDPLAREEWDRVAPELYGIGLLTIPDTGTLAAYCMSYSRWRAAEEALQREAKTNDKALHGAALIKTKEGNLIQHPLVGVANMARRDMVRFAAEFGLTPSARANLGNPGTGGGSKTKKAESKFFGSE